MMNEPLVSIVLPTYKRAHLLAGAINSVLTQTWSNWELIVVDDNSPDDTRELVASYTDPRIRYLRNEPNLKLPRALNRGFAAAAGDLLTWTSDDNLFMPEAIERMVARLRIGDCDLVYADYYLFSEQDSQGKPADPQLDRLPDEVQLERGNHIGACFLYTRQLYQTVGEYDPELFLVEDYDYFIRAARYFRLAHIARPLYYFRRDDGTLYLSRFAEVKASDLLVRFKNDLLDEGGVIDQMIALLLRHGEFRHARLLNWTTRIAAASGSWRLTQWQQRWVAARLRRQLGSRVRNELRRYRLQRAGFGSVRDALRELMSEVAEIKYVQV